MKLLLHSPVGLLLAEYGDAGLAALRFWRQGEHPPAGTRDAPAHGDALGRQISRELDEYFRGERRDFALPLAPAGTAFQRRVWDLLLEIPFGQTRTYAELAAHLGQPGAARAVGSANGANPISIVVPCHRVVAAGGRLGGYGGGLDAKRWLLNHESLGGFGPPA